MRRTGFSFLVASSVLAAAVGQTFLSVARASRSPQYGGTLRVEMRARIASLDPREIPSDPASAAASERLAALVFDRLVRLDENGQAVPALAVAWEHDAQFQRWQFRLRRGVRFHDGTPLTPGAAVAAWQLLHGAEPLASVSGEWAVFRSEQPMPDLLLELARGHNFVFGLTSEGGINGTGAFRIARWQAERRLVLAGNEDYWAGRPFVDAIEVEMGVNAPQQVIDLELGKADVTDLTADQVRRAAQGGARVWSSAPVELLALVFDPKRPAVQDVRLRQALSLAIDRSAICNVLLQKRGEPAGGLLPQWLSGYAFLFSSAADVERARKLVGGLSPAPGALALVYDGADPQARAVAARIAVDARQAGITIQVAPAGSASTAVNGLRLVRLRLASIQPRVALAGLVATLGMQDAAPALSPEPEHLYAAERVLVEGYRVVPLAHLPEIYGLGSRVKNWIPPRWGGWRLEDVWLDTTPSLAAGGVRP